MKQYFINADLYDEEYQQLYKREENAEETETAYRLIREKTGSALLVPKTACLELTAEEYNRLRELNEGSTQFSREAFVLISSKLEQVLQSV
ncbi:hypothetical protein [Gorillibacterium sp. sgz500922]|uniref:hypothetical protein n=1 Tax=Gorillibacterium sp. sgz500922 TaxID=3446694 RepID=UPI003F661C10